MTDDTGSISRLTQQNLALANQLQVAEILISRLQSAMNEMRKTIEDRTSGPPLVYRDLIRAMEYIDEYRRAYR